jgi:hypothetical protein
MGSMLSMTQAAFRQFRQFPPVAAVYHGKNAETIEA